MQARKPIKPPYLEPLYSLRPGVNDKIFNNVKFDKESRSLIEISCNNPNAARRHAVVGWVPLESSTNNPSIAVLESRSRPGLPADATNEEIGIAGEIFGVNNFVVAQKGAPGIVHVNTIDQVESSEARLREIHDQVKFIGLSFFVTQMSGKKALLWMNRSAQNKQLFKRNDLAVACLTFTFSATAEDISSHPPHTIAYDLHRSAPRAVFLNFLESAQNDLESAQDNSGLRCTHSREDCYSFEGEKIWDTIRRMPDNKLQLKKIQEMLMTNIYIGSSRPPSNSDSKDAPANPLTNGYDSELIQIFKAASDNNIPLDLQFVPEIYKEKTNNATALMMATQRGYLQIASILIENKADLEAKDANGLTPLLWAVLNGKFEMAELLIKNGASVNCKTSANETLADCFFRSIWNKFDFEHRDDAIHVIKDFMAQFSKFPEMMRIFPQIFYKKNSLAGNNSLISYLEIELDANLKNYDLVAARKLLNGLPVTVIKALVDQKDSAGNTKLFNAINANNNAFIEFLIEKGASIDFEAIRDCKDPDLRLNMVHWAKMRGDQFKLSSLDKFNSAYSSTIKMVFQKSTNEPEFHEYSRRCDLIASRIPKENDHSSSRYAAINTFYAMAKEFKTEKAFTDELNFFSKLDLFISELSPEIKSECQSAYAMYAEKSPQTFKDMQDHFSMRRMILNDIILKISSSALDEDLQDKLINSLNSIEGTFDKSTVIFDRRT